MKSIRILLGTHAVDAEMGQRVDLPAEIPLQPGESFEAGLARVAPLIRDSLGIHEAAEIDPRAWARIKKMAEVR